MNAGEFRKIALGFPGAIESAHMDHPDFRAGGKIFATLGYPGTAWGMVKLTPAQQRDFRAKSPAVFRPANGAWGKAGSTLVLLEAANESVVRAVIEAAWKGTTTPQPKKRRR